MEEEFAYKVVRKEGKKLLSAWVHNFGKIASAAIVEYKVNRWVGNKRGHGPLGTFKFKEEAERFRNLFCEYGLIYTCQIQKSNKWNIFWFLCPSGIKHFSNSNYTVFARKVKLLKEIK
jgi:hypothetical protein